MGFHDIYTGELPEICTTTPILVKSDNYNRHVAVSWHKQFVSGPMFTTRPVSVEFLMHKVAMGQVVLCTLQSSPVHIISLTLHIRVSLTCN